VLINGHPNSRIRHGGAPGATLALAGQAGSWRKYKCSDSTLNRAFMKQKANAAWPIIKYDDGTHGIIT
jgi:hypothetical protein